MQQFITAETAQIGTELMSDSRQWSLEAFIGRHDMVYGPGNVIEQQWPEKNIHADEEAAKREGLDRPVVAAPQIIAQLSKVMMSHFGEGWVRGGKINVKMIKPVYPEDFTVAKVTITGLTKEPAGGVDTVRVHCDCSVSVIGAHPVMVGTASALCT